MTRLLAFVALAVAATLVWVIVASYGSSPSTAATSSATTPPVVAPAIPCSSSAQPTPTPTATTWTGAFERVTADLESDGSVKKTPRQFTRVSAEGSEPVTVDVPMSDKRLHRRDRGKKPSFSNGMAHVDLDPSGTKTQEFDSDFAGSLAVAVKGQLHGQWQAGVGERRQAKSGTVEVEYQLDNTTAKPVTVCFKGFNGAPRPSRP
jgi:hypothetical protein